MSSMGRRKNGVSTFGLKVSAAIRAEAGMRLMSASDIARAIGKSQSYVHDRMYDDKEWTLADLGELTELWDMTLEELLRKYS